MPFRAPLSDIRFILGKVVPLAPVAETELFAEATADLAEAVLGEAAKLCDEVLAPVNRAGDMTSARLENGVVRTSPGFAEAYRAIAEGGWVAVSAPVASGGMGLPQALNMAIHDMMSGACLSLQLNPLLTQGQIEALDHHASDDIKALYLPKLISGDWSGTMNLTEPQAGSDVGALRTKAEPNGDGTYTITGQKIFISWGDSDITKNVCHLVLARLPGAVEGTKGISLFLVPKLLPDDDGQPGARNGVRVVSLEHKLGLHGSPTCVMEYDGATGWLIGEENRGMAAMFTMMNNARLGVAMQGIGVAEAACQMAVEFAQDRRQMGVIADHPDVRRMLATMRAEVFAARSIALACAVAGDMATATGDRDWAARAAFLTPIAKSYGTQTGMDVSEMAMQVHGGMGYIEETGVAQFYRDVRVTAIYEGTNGIQAMDLVGRKLSDDGEAAYRLLEEIETGAEVARVTLPDLAEDVWAAAETLRESTEWMVTQEMPDRCAGAAPYLSAFALVLGAHYHLRAALAEGGTGARANLARFHIRRLLPQYTAHLTAARDGANGVMALSPEALAS
ncbi:acyl-CoA dehydrogenase [Albidovulum aquaemixtae]|nr:acyl-CoA dehydrogenase [Defluviimonas aquaemixtae]